MPTHRSRTLFDVIDDNDDPEAIAQALARGALVDEQDDSNAMRTPLMMAAKEGGPHAVRLLLAAGANVHLQDDSGWSALHHLAGADEPNLESLELLLAAGASPDAIARSYSFWEEQEENDEDEDEVTTDPLDGAETPMVLAATFSNPAVLKRLLDAGGTPRLEQLRGALSHGMGEAARLLLPFFPDVTSVDMRNMWPSDPLPGPALAAFETALAERAAARLEKQLPQSGRTPGKGPRL